MSEHSYNLVYSDEQQRDSVPRDGVEDSVFTMELRRAIATTREFFFTHQHPDGYWVAELEGDVLLESETILLLAFLGEENGELAVSCSRYIVEKQLPDGGWSMYAGGKADVNNTVKAYFALKLTGHAPSTDYMQRARRRAVELGGADAVNSFTRFYLAILGQIPHSLCPSVPPQMMLLPKWSPISIRDMSAWSRTIFVPLSIVSALQPVRELPPEKSIRELFIDEPKNWKPLTAPGKHVSRSPFSWDFFFRTADNTIRLCRKFGVTPLRKRAIKAAEEWMLKHNEGSDGPGAIYPPIIWEWVALKALGYSNESPEVRYCRDQLTALIIHDPDKNQTHLQPCKSPVWDTTLTLKALMLSGLTTDNKQVRKAVRWVRSRQITKRGDWSERVKAEPGGWCFEFNNDFYPDNDDTAMALMVLAGRFDETKRETYNSIHDTKQNDNAAKTNALPPDIRLVTHDVRGSLDDAKNEMLDVSDTAAAIERGTNWLLAMQNRDGGWAAFDRNNDKEFLCRVPFADHNAMIDPSTPDLTGRVMESLGRLGFRVDENKQIDKAVAYLRRSQRPDGSWFGRWGINYIYGTWQALTGLTAVGISTDDAAIRAGANWLTVHQQPTGAWGETADSYDDERLRGTGNPTASQTAWAIMGLLAAGKTESEPVSKGIRYLLNQQREDGTWQEDYSTGGGFPRVFYLKYHYYSVYFPLMALSLYAAKTHKTNPAVSAAIQTLPLCKIRLFAPETDYYNNVRKGVQTTPMLRLYKG